MKPLYSLVLALPLFLAAPAGAQSLENELLENAGQTSSGFGSTCDLSGETAVVGEPHRNNNNNGQASGAAFIFVRSGTDWPQKKKLLASDGQPFDSFGRSVAIDGDTVVVGADSHSLPGALGAGAAYVFVGSGINWSQQAKLTSLNPAAFAGLGVRVAISGDFIAVAVYVPFSGNCEGRVEVFERVGTQWFHRQTLTPACAGNPTRRFGSSLALHEDTLVVGDNGVESAFVFVRNASTWTQQAQLVASDPDLDGFGGEVGVDYDTVVVGAAGADGLLGNNEGAAYMFTRSGTSWTEQAILTASDPSPDSNFGSAVSVDGDAVVIGAVKKKRAYVSTRSGTQWTEDAILDPPTPGWKFGSAVAIDDDTVLVGDVDHFNSVWGFKAGSVWAYRMNFGSTNYCTAGNSASGCTASISSSGTASASAPSGFALSAAGVEGSKDGLFFLGTNGRQGNSWGSSTSYQCIAPPVFRAGLLAGSGTSGLCDGSFNQDLNALWCPTCPKPLKNPGAGALVQAQLWYRDPFNTSNQSTSMSDAIEFTVGP